MFCFLFFCFFWGTVKTSELFAPRHIALNPPKNNNNNNKKIKKLLIFIIVPWVFHLHNAPRPSYRASPQFVLNTKNKQTTPPEQPNQHGYTSFINDIEMLYIYIYIYVSKFNIGFCKIKYFCVIVFLLYSVYSCG